MQCPSLIVLTDLTLAGKLWFMSNEMTVTQFASLGGNARAKALSAKERREIARLGAIAAQASGKRLGRPIGSKRAKSEQ